MDNRDGTLTIEVIADDLTELHKEAGGHRIQRIPPTEKRGRVHSSTVTVAVLEYLARPTFEYNDRDFKIEWYSGTGCGGQNRNKVQSSCRLTHLPTGVCQTAQTRSRENSLKLAKEALLKLLSETHWNKSRAHADVIRQVQVGSGERGDKFRTYRFQDGLVKDHRTNRQASIDKVLAGNFNLLW